MNLLVMEICCEEEKFQYDEDSLIDHLINQHLAKRNEAIEKHIKTISSTESQLTEKDKDHDIKINAVNEKLKIAEENVKAMKTEIEKQKQNVHEEKKLFKCQQKTPIKCIFSSFAKFTVGHQI